MPKEFNNLGISFLYPDNWTVEQNDSSDDGPQVTVFSPNTAFWVVSVHPPLTEPDQLAMAAVEVMKDEYEGLEIEPAAEKIADHSATGYDLNFYCENLTNTARVRCLRANRATLAFFCQAEDRELPQVEQVFQAITVSLLGRLDEQG